MSTKSQTSHNRRSVLGLGAGVIKGEQLSLLIALVSLSVLLSLLSPMFFTLGNFANLFKQASIVGIAALGACLIILVGEIDLSVGTLQAAAGCLVVWLLNSVFGNFWLAFLGTLLFGVGVGYINSRIVLKGRINSFIATLGVMAILKGATFVLTSASSIGNHVDGFDFIGTGIFLGIPVPVYIFVALSFGFHFMLDRTVFGRNVYAVGGNANAARLAGLDVDRIKTWVFIIGSALGAFTAVISASRMNSGQPTAGIGFELIVISAVILGGFSMTGGRGKVLGVILGVLILSVLNNGLVLLNISSFWQEIARGTVIIFAVFLDEKRRRDMTKVRNLKAA